MDACETCGGLGWDLEANDKDKACPDCNGHGYFNDDYENDPKCAYCHGLGGDYMNDGATRCPLCHDY